MNNTKNRFNLTWLKHLTIQVFFSYITRHQIKSMEWKSRL